MLLERGQTARKTYNHPDGSAMVWEWASVGRALSEAGGAGCALGSLAGAGRGRGVWGGGRGVWAAAAASAARAARMGRPLALALAAAAAAPAAPAPPLPRLPLGLALLLLLLAQAAPLRAASEQHPQPANGTEGQGVLWRGGQLQTTANDGDSLGKESRAVAKNAGTLHGENASETSQASGVKESQLKPPAVRGRVGDTPAVDSPPGTSVSVRFMEEEKNESGLCLGCSENWEGGQALQPVWARQRRQEDGEKRPMEALSGATVFARPVEGPDAPDTAWKEVPRMPASDSREETGSGDQHQLNQEGVAEGAPVPTDPPFAPQTSSPSGDNNAEGDLFLGPFGDKASTTSTANGGPASKDQDSAQKEEPLELWLETASTVSPSEGTQGHTDLSWPDVETPPPAAVTPLIPKPSPDPLASEIIDVDYYDLFDGGEGLAGAPGPDSTKRQPSEDKGMSWSLHDLYDDFTPFDEADFYPTTSFYTDGDEEEDLEEPEEEEDLEEEDAEDDGEQDGRGGPARDLEDENDMRVPTAKAPTTAAHDPEPTGRHFLVPPLQTFIISAGSGPAVSPRPRPAETGRDLHHAVAGSSSENSTECRSGYLRHNTTCKSVCDTFPSYCHNGGQCYLVENLGAFCRCNTQDYIWHKGMRCESIITDFQVMCVAVGSAALVVLLLFMMTVFFAKKLYLLKTENSKLRKTKYRTPSELHNDNFSLSTIAEGSHPNVRKFCDTPCNLSPHARALAYYDNIICQDDPGAPHKLPALSPILYFCILFFLIYSSLPPC
ncbi:chondroitin sulfate proteoglycan 5 isoform X2 [Anolis carolinensis]|uniref:chondroitin sulfate proteoglycan 5 isoform X2 n=1 Tax=Anolis carolinensis TaxID=28377 RepID=UPI002F2B3B06